MIRLIPFNEGNLISKCVQLAEINYFENMILLGDLYPPCKDETEVYGVFSNEGELITFFTIFYGFADPSVVLPHNLETDYFEEIVPFLKTKLLKAFGLPSFCLTKEQLSEHFEVIEITSEYAMISEDREKVNQIDLSSVQNYKEKDFEKINAFYELTGNYTFTSLQLKSGFYHFIKTNSEIVSCGGIHFETPNLAQLGNIFTLLEHRRKGYGQEVVAAITKKILQNKKYASLFVLRDNQVAIQIYEKLGFKLYKDVNIFFLKYSS